MNFLLADDHSIAVNGIAILIEEIFSEVSIEEVRAVMVMEATLTLIL